MPNGSWETAEIIRRHDLYALVTAMMGSLVISQETLDQFIERREGLRQTGSLRQVGTLASRDGNAIVLPDIPVLREGRMEDRKSALAWLRANSRIVAAAGTPGLAGKLRTRLPEGACDLLISDMLAAAQAKLPILSDDLGYRELTDTVAPVASGLIAVLIKGLETGFIDRSTYIQKLSGLAQAGHGALPLGDIDLVDALKLDGGEIGLSTRAFIAQLGGHGADIESHLEVAISAITLLWACPELHGQRLQFVLLVADRLLQRAPDARARFGEALMRDPQAAPTLLRHYIEAFSDAWETADVRVASA